MYRDMRKKYQNLPSKDWFNNIDFLTYLEALNTIDLHTKTYQNLS